MGFPGTISLRLETFQSLLSDIFRSIHANGFERIVSVNGHGGNHAPCRALSWAIAEEDIFTLSFSWWDMGERELREWRATDEGVGHAGEWETSVQLHLRAHLILTCLAGNLTLPLLLDAGSGLLWSPYQFI